MQLRSNLQPNNNNILHSRKENYSGDQDQFKGLKRHRDILLKFNRQYMTGKTAASMTQKR